MKTPFADSFRRGCGPLAVATIAAHIIGCGADKKPDATPTPDRPSFTERLKPYVPASRPADPVTDGLPDAPQDPQSLVPLRYTVELWEILMPRGSVSADEKFWRRVEESPTPDAQQLLKNGVRTGELPVTEIEAFRKMIDDRGGKHTVYTGVSGRMVEIPVRKNVPDQIVFYHDHDDALVGRSWENCDNLFFFSFESTPRSPDQVRIAFTPAVRSNEKKLVYAIAPGKADRELKTVVEQSNYDVTVSADLRLDRMLVIAPSAEAQQPHTIGGTFLIETSPAQQQERVILVHPHAYTREEIVPPAAPK